MATAHITELTAVNRMLASIGETPVNTLETGLTEGALALNMLREVSREVQLTGWEVNTWKKYKLTKNSSDQFALGTDVLRVTTTYTSKYINTVLKRSEDNTKYLLWDVENHTEVWENVSELYVDIVYCIDFDKLTPALQHYILFKAGHEFQKGRVSSGILYEFTHESVIFALQQAEAEESDNSRSNVLRDSEEMYLTTYRNNNLWGF